MPTPRPGVANERTNMVGHVVLALVWFCLFTSVGSDVFAHSLISLFLRFEAGIFSSLFPLLAVAWGAIAFKEAQFHALACSSHARGSGQAQSGLYFSAKWDCPLAYPII